MRPALSNAALPLAALLTVCCLPAQARAAVPTPVQACGAAASAALPAGVRAGVYRGTLGGRAVLLELRRSPDDLDEADGDRYAYARFGVALALDRGAAGGALVLAEYRQDFPDPHPAACFTLRPGAGGTLTGTWRSLKAGGLKGSGAALPVTLTRLNVAALPLSLPNTAAVRKLRADDPFTFVRLNHPWTPLGAGRVREPLTGLSSPRAAGGSAALNLALAARQLQHAADALDCRAQVQASGLDGGWSADDFTVDARLTWRSPHLLGLSEALGAFCGGAHPESWQEGVTLDALTGRAVTLAGGPGSLWPGLSAARLQALYMARYAQPTDISPSDAAECRDALSGEEGRDAGGGLPYALTLTRAGLEVWPNYLPHVIVACADVVTVPYAALRALANPGSPYYRDVYPR